jgi:hypothetical protein
MAAAARAASPVAASGDPATLAPGAMPAGGAAPDDPEPGPGGGE